MREDSIKSSLDKIKAPESRKEHVYYEIINMKENKRNKKKLVYIKRVADRYVGYVAACLVLVTAFSIYAVNSGLFDSSAVVNNNSAIDMRGDVAVADIDSVNVYVPIDDTYSVYSVSSADDIFTFWSNVSALGVYPADIRLDRVESDENTYKVFFDESLQAYTDENGENLCMGIAKTLSEFYGEDTKIELYSNDVKVSVNGAEIDFSAMSELEIME